VAATYCVAKLSQTLAHNGRKFKWGGLRCLYRVLVSGFGLVILLRGTLIVFFGMELKAGVLGMNNDVFQSLLTFRVQILF